MINRRGLITGLISLAAAPAIVRASSLMPVKVIKTEFIKITKYLNTENYQLEILYGTIFWKAEHDPNTVDGIVLTNLDPYTKLD